MHTPCPDQLPDVVVGRHPDYGIVAANPKQLPTSTWMLTRLDFHPVPGHDSLYALSDQHRDGQGRAVPAVALLRRSGYQVDVDAALDPSLGPGPDRFRRLRAGGDPDVAFAEHPHLGVVAATDDHAPAIGSRILEEHGWRLNPILDVYTLPVTTDRSEALAKVATATAAMHRSDVLVAVQPRLAQNVLARRGVRHEHNQTLDDERSPTRSAASGTSPALAGLRSSMPVSPSAAVVPTPSPAPPFTSSFGR
ncbi:hypothetical protein [Streptomyces sp. NPDC059575]|uniref:hypothetical protein n=1 Tax=Streptomyces sp. NPDC059575 TaxID=3346872 RepID=UPI0036809249